MSRNYSFYAPPLVFSPWVNVGSHGGSVTYAISFSPLGDTLIQAEIRYFRYEKLPRVEEPINSGGSIVTANVFANVEMRFKGFPLGSAVDVTIEP
jgi:hypothetical protein